MFLQLARELGIRVLGTDRASGSEHVQAHGATLIVFEHEDVLARCRELTGGRGVDSAYDGVGGTVRTSWRALRPCGRLVWFGMSSMVGRWGAGPARHRRAARHRGRRIRREPPAERQTRDAVQHPAAGPRPSCDPPAAHEDCGATSTGGAGR
ncbi:zinc-binding dehydrogenase [Pseudonocardia xishanensis]|uniref:Alcohol dehydrogenase-like C-terminal domain-containing protein n=1 Tax=Pseudonocardia xishanensis TaxID=630995 RepID=A0ABP8RSF5_9PSEU